MVRCEGYRRNGGAFSLGPVKWQQCKNDAIVKLTVMQDNKKEIFPACKKYWKECIENKLIKILWVNSS